MSKSPRHPRQPTVDKQAATSPPARDRVPRLAWLVLVLIVLLFVALPVYRWYGTVREDTVKLDVERQQAVARDRLSELPSEAVYPSVEDLRAEADAISETLLERYPDSARAIHIAASQAAQLRQYERAIELWQRAVELAPNFIGPRAGLAMAHMEQGNDKRAVELLKVALQSDQPTAETYQLLSRALQKTGDFERAETVCREGLNRYPRDAALWLELGQLQLQLQSLDDARESLLKVVQLQPDSTPAYFSLATVAARSGDAEQAKQYKARYSELKEQHPLTDVRFQVIYRASLQRIVVASLVSAANEHQRQGDDTTAEKYLLRALELHPRDVEACRALVALYRRQQRIADAHLVQQRLLDVQPTVENLVNLASLAVPMQRYREAEAALEAALQLNPQSVVAQRSLVLLYQHTGQLNKAQSHAEQLARLHSTAEHYELLGQICLEAGDQSGYRSAVQNAQRIRER